jgi:hypothetical protein
LEGKAGAIIDGISSSEEGLKNREEDKKYSGTRNV